MRAISFINFLNKREFLVLLSDFISFLSNHKFMCHQKLCTPRGEVLQNVWKRDFLIDIENPPVFD